MEKGKLYLIPSPLGDYDPKLVMPQAVLDLLPHIHTYVVEEVRTARRYLSVAGLKGQIEGLDFHELNEHTDPRDIEAFAVLFDNGNDVGLITEAGLPAVADPGALLVALCHRIGVKVVPCVGPSSLMMALMGSGLNGQSFAFCGYLPAKTEERRGALRNIEKRSAQLHQTEIFIETPYRNDALLCDAVKILAPKTRLTIAVDITLSDETILTKSVAQWRSLLASSNQPLIGKRPCVFLILA